jgi:hypothetical protein
MLHFKKIRYNYGIIDNIIIYKSEAGGMGRKSFENPSCAFDATLQTVLHVKEVS